ncbi:MAG: type II secretion system protein, partial [Bacteroidota bacterium]
MSIRTLKFSARWMSYKAPAYTLTELLVVLVIIGILVLLAMPNFGGVVTQAYETEAKLQLENLHGLQEAYYYQHHRYATDLAEIGFQQQKLVTDGGNARYRIEV